MTKLLSLLVLLAIIVAAFLYLKPASDYSPQTIKGLPWQIELLPDGSSKVFGITLGQSRLSDKGLDLTINKDGKHVLQYVAPREFAALRDPLR